MQKNNFWFTIVELVVVVIILWVLATIGFISYNGYLEWARDGNRITQTKDIYKSLQLYATNRLLPLPDDAVEITANGTTVWYQWYAGEGVLSLANYNNGGVDPKDNTYFTYVVSSNRKELQILTFLEERNLLETEVVYQAPFIPQIYANTLGNRFPKTTGTELWVLLQESTNIPIQDIADISTWGSLDVATTWDSYTIIFSDTSKITWGSQEILTVLWIQNQNILQHDSSLVWYWDMETTINVWWRNLLRDFSIYGNHGQCQDGSATQVDCFSSNDWPQLVDGNGKTWKATRFDGIDDGHLGAAVDYILVPDSASISPSNITIVVLWKTKDNSNINSPTYLRKGSDYFMDHSAPTATPYRFWRNSIFDELLSEFNGFGKYNVFVGTYWPDNFNLYINSQLKASASYTTGISDTSNDLHIWARNDLQQRNFPWDIDEVRIYNRALSEEEAIAISNFLN